MKAFRVAGFVLALAGVIGVAHGQGQAAQLAADGWRVVLPSQTHDFAVRCFKGKDLVWGVYPRGGTNEWSVARNIWVRSANDGRITAISLQRGFVTADIPVMYFPANDVSCEMTQQ
jgi:hypothetical protein